MNYNLLDEKWIPVLYQDGKYDQVGIFQALTDAHKIRQIAACNPMDRVAIFRFLLALLYWCKGNPPGDLPTYAEKAFPNDWFTKLDENRDCFNLLGNGKRFYQHQAKTGVPDKLTANYLMQEIPTGSNWYHFCHSKDKDNGLCPACCAKGLLRLPLFATSGGRGKPPGINSKPQIYIIPLGSCLFESLLLSWQNQKQNELGEPTWVKPDIQLPAKGKVTLLTGLTWLPRRVWLDTPKTDEENCIACGVKAKLIKQSVFAGIGSTKAESDDERRNWDDPHVIYDNKNVLKPSDSLKAYDAASGRWTKLVIGILIQKKAINPHRFIAVSFATIQNDKYIEAKECEVSFNVNTDSFNPQKAVEKIDYWSKENSKLISRCKPMKSSRKHAEIRPMIDSVRPHIETQIFDKIHALLTGGSEAWEQAAGDYSPMMSVVAQSLAPGYTTAAVQRRREIAAVKPNIKLKMTATDRAGRKKGADA